MILAEQDSEITGALVWCVMWVFIIVMLIVGFSLVPTHKPKCWHKAAYDSEPGYITETTCHLSRGHSGNHRDDEGFEWKQ